MKNIFVKSHVITVALFLAAVSVLAEPEIKGTPAELKAYLAGLPGTVQIAGEGEITAVADEAVVSLRIDTENKSLAEASKSNQGIRAKLAAFLKEQGIGAERIQPTPFSSTQKTKIFSDKVKSHKVSTLVKVTTHNEQEFQAVTKSVDQFEEVTYVQAEFEHTDKATLKTKATEKACDDAERKRRVYEEKLNVKLAVRNIRDLKQPMPMLRPNEVSDNLLTSGLRNPSGFFPGTSIAPLQTEVSEEETPFGELVFNARVLVEYTVEPK